MRLCGCCPGGVGVGVSTGLPRVCVNTEYCVILRSMYCALCSRGCIVCQVQALS